jgi:hypothetical protein
MVLLLLLTSIFSDYGWAAVAARSSSLPLYLRVSFIVFTVSVEEKR